VPRAWRGALHRLIFHLDLRHSINAVPSNPSARGMPRHTLATVVRRAPNSEKYHRLRNGQKMTAPKTAHFIPLRPHVNDDSAPARPPRLKVSICRLKCESLLSSCAVRDLPASNTYNGASRGITI
jgi:hypothetical protein